MDRRAFLEEWFERVWIQGDIAFAREKMHTDTSVAGLTEGPQMNVDDFIGFAEAFNTQFDMTGCKIDFLCENDDWSQMHVTFHGKGRHTGKQATFTGQILVRMKDDLLVEGYNNIDFLSLFQQMDMLPSDLMARALSGQATKSSSA